MGPNDDADMGRSSNDSFPLAMNVAAVTLLGKRLVPGLDRPATAIDADAEYGEVIVPKNMVAPRGEGA